MFLKNDYKKYYCFRCPSSVTVNDVIIVYLTKKIHKQLYVVVYLTITLQLYVTFHSLTAGDL